MYPTAIERALMPKDFECSRDPHETSLREAGTASCRWILRRQRFGQFVICGRPTRLGSSFCAEHHDLVWRAAKDGR